MLENLTHFNLVEFWIWWALKFVIKSLKRRKPHTVPSKSNVYCVIIQIHYKKIKCHSMIPIKIANKMFISLSFRISAIKWIHKHHPAQNRIDEKGTNNFTIHLIQHYTGTIKPKISITHNINCNFQRLWISTKNNKYKII